MRLLAIALLLCGLSWAFGAAAVRAAPERVIAGYVLAREGAIRPDEIAAGKLTHVNYAFVDVRNGRLTEHAPPDAASLAALTGLRKQSPRLRVLVSVGGWEGSRPFSQLARSAASRARFVASALAFLRRHDLDGLDVDWEYPGLPGNDNPHGPADREAFTALLADLRAGFDRDGAARGRKLLLTIAAGAFPEYLEHVDLARVQASLDLVHLMAYDFRVPEGGDEAGHHANLRAHPADPRQLSAERTVREFLAAGVPKEKLVLGVPFYGRAWRGVRTKTEGLYHEGRPVPGFDATYGALAKLVGTDGWVRGWDEAAQAPYLWNAARKTFVSYEDPESLRLKCRFVREQGLAGVMFWEYHSDPTGALLDALVEGLRSPAR